MRFLSFFLSLIVLLSLSCTRNLTQPKYISLYGRVLVQGESKVEGVTAALYAIQAPDSALLALQQDYPSLPVLQTQPNLFDHRRQEPLYVTTVDSDGNYEFVDIPEADYNLVLEKRGYGWRYLYDVNQMQELPQVTLSREVRKSGLLDSYTEWPANQHILIAGNVTVPEGGALLIDKGAVIRFEGNTRIIGKGQINCFGTVDDPIWFTSNTVGRLETQTYWNSIDVNSSATLKNFRMDHAKVAVSAKKATLTIERGVFSDITDTGIFAANESVADISSCHFGHSNNGVLLEAQSHGTVKYSTFSDLQLTAESSGITGNVSEITVEDNLLLNCSRGVSVLYGTSGQIDHNIISNCRVGIYNFSFDRDIPFSILYNTLSQCRDIFIEIHHASAPVIHYNNFGGLSGQDLIYAYSQSLYYYVDIDATHNYWDGLAVSEALRLMKDERVVKEGGTTPTWEILVKPVAGDPIEEAHPR